MATYVTGKHTETAGTEITEVCPPNGSMIPVLRGFSYTAAGTEHSLFVIGARGYTTTVTFTASGDTTMDLARNDPGQTSAAVDEDLAAGDWVAYETQYGNLEVREISSISASTITLASGVTDDVATGAKVWAFYEDAATNIGAIEISCAASTTVTYDNLHVQGGVPHQRGVQNSVTGVGMPLLVVVDNATAAGTLEYASFEWIAAEEDFTK